MSETNEELTARLNQETAKLSWTELERHFARGSVIKVEQGEDLILTAVLFANDDAKAIEDKISQRLVANATMDDAKTWNERQSEFWAVVVAPFVLVQEILPKIN